MYIFEFKHKLDKDDLSHIWQNLPPKLGVKAEESYATVSHELFTNELMGDWKAVANLQLAATERSGFESEVRWMVFKAKQRAKTNYFEQIAGSGANAVAAQIPKYSYNWPYDFCSIVEMINIEPEIEFGIDEMKLRDAVQSKLADEAANWKGGALASMAGAGTSSRRPMAGAAGANKPPDITEEEIYQLRAAEWAFFETTSGYGNLTTKLWDICTVGNKNEEKTDCYDPILTRLRIEWQFEGQLPEVCFGMDGSNSKPGAASYEDCYTYGGAHLKSYVGVRITRSAKN
jgi:hypothetical protein